MKPDSMNHEGQPWERRLRVLKAKESAAERDAAQRAAQASSQQPIVANQTQATQTYPSAPIVPGESGC